MSTTLTQPLPVTPLATVPPSIALARDECLEKHRERLSQKPSAFELMKNARVARLMYQHYLLRQFTRFLVSCLSFARHPDAKYPVDLQISASTKASPVRTHHRLRRPMGASEKTNERVRQ
jgi:hypothetical protein